MKIGKLFLTVFIILLSRQVCLSQLKVDINAKKDNTLFDDAAGAFSNGIGEYLFAGKTKQDKIRRGLIAFDVAAALPAGAIIDSVRLRLNMSKTVAGPQPVQLLRVLADWGEGASDAGANEGTGATSMPGDATWLHRFFNMTLWASPGGDFVTTVSATGMVAGDGAYIWQTTPQMVADVQLWLNTPANNFGWLLRGNESVVTTAKRFDSRENTVVANRPLLTVFYRTATRVEDKNQTAPATFSLAQNYPNPFFANGTFGNSNTTIRFDLPAAANVSLQILDLTGRELETLAAGRFSAGVHRVQWNAEKYSGGVYLYRLSANHYLATKKLILLR